jgi:hypothetical protein
VVAGISALMEKQAEQKRSPLFSWPASAQSAAPAVQPALKAQTVVEQNVEQKKKGDVIAMIVMSVIIVVQLAFFGYIMLGM